MTIHHATETKAKKMGVILSEKVEDGVPVFHAHWTKRNKRLSGENIKILMDEMTAMIDMTMNYRSFKYKEEEDGDRTVSVKLAKGEAKATDPYLHRAFEQVKKMWLDSRAELADDEEAEDEDGEAVEDPDDEEAKGGSVVASRYRQLYAEQGHPTHCGDWLANVLNNLCANDGGTNIGFFEAICNANDIDLTKYDRTSHGWQGRVRMTGRNLLARRVYLNNGVLLIPNAEPMQAPAEWMAGKNYKASAKKKAA